MHIMEDLRHNYRWQTAGERKIQLKVAKMLWDAILNHKGTEEDLTKLINKLACWLDGVNADDIRMRLELWWKFTRFNDDNDARRFWCARWRERLKKISHSQTG